MTDFITDPLLPRSSISPFPANETERLAALHRHKILDTPAETAFDRITSLAARLFHMPTALISLVDESRAWFKSSVGFSAPEVSRDATICSFAVLTDEPLIVSDTRLDERFACNPFVQCEPGMRFYAGAPLIDRDGFNLGTLCLLDIVPREPLTAEQQATLVDLAAMVVDELELRLAAQQLARVDAALIEITQGVAAVTGEAFFEALVRHFAKVLGTDYVYIGLVEGNEPKMMRTIATCAHGQIAENLEYLLRDTPCWEAVEQRKICCYPRNVRAEFPNAPLLKPLSVESYVAIPFFDSNDNVLGLLGVMDGKPLENVNLAESLLTIFADRIATELERQRSELMLVEQTRLLEAIATGQTLDECLSALCRSIAKLSPSTRACVLLTDDLCQKFPRAITPDFLPSLSQGLKDVPINELAIGTCGTAVYSGQTIACNDIAHDDRWSAGWRELCVAHGILACYSAPIMGSDNLPWGSLMLCFSEARQPTDWEYKLAEFGTKIASITIDRKQAEEDLRQAQAIAQRQLVEIEAIYQTAPIGLAILDPDLRYERINQRLAEINGIAMTDHIGRTVREIIPNLADENEPLLRGVLETGEPLLNVEISGETQAQPGTYRTWIENCYPLKDGNGRSIGINVVVQEITDRKQIEKSLKQSEERLSLALEGAGMATWDVDMQTHQRIWSANHFKLLGYEPIENGEATSEMWRSRVHPDDLEQVSLQTNCAQQMCSTISLEPRIIRADNGEIRWLNVFGRFVCNEVGEAIRCIGVSFDISDRKQAEVTLAERNKELDSFVHTVSHDLKAPLRAISNLSEWIEDDLEGQLPPDNQQQLQLLRTRVKRMESMINSLLLYARVGRQEAPLETFNVAELLSEIIDSLDPPQSFSIEIEPPMPTLTTKRLLLSQVFANLIGNAIKHHTSVEGHLNLAAIEQRDFYEFRVRDDGPGIAPEDRTKIFEIFQTLKAEDNSENTGVGLAIVKKIVEREKGTIRLESHLGQGTTFFFTWPKHHS